MYGIVSGTPAVAIADCHCLEHCCQSPSLQPDVRSRRVQQPAGGDRRRVRSSSPSLQLSARVHRAPRLPCRRRRRRSLERNSSKCHHFTVLTEMSGAQAVEGRFSPCQAKGGAGRKVSPCKLSQRRRARAHYAHAPTAAAAGSEHRNCTHYCSLPATGTWRFFAKCCCCRCSVWPARALTESAAAFDTLSVVQTEMSGAQAVGAPFSPSPAKRGAGRKELPSKFSHRRPPRAHYAQAPTRLLCNCTHHRRDGTCNFFAAPTGKWTAATLSQGKNPPATAALPMVREVTADTEGEKP